MVSVVGKHATSDRCRGAKRRDRFGATAAIACAFTLHVAAVRGDVGPPVCIRLPDDAGQAVAGEAYSGVFEVHVALPGVVSGIELSGDGWQVLSAELPETEGPAQAGVLLVPFQVIPTDPDQPITLTLVYEGRRVSRSYRLGPDAFRYADTDRPSMRVAPAAIAPVPEPERATEENGSTEGAAATLRFTGRIVYLRPSGFDIDGDPILVDGTYEGVDNVWVEVMDEDDIVDETIWSGYTNAAGYFDTGNISWDDGGDLPDIYMRWECDTPVVNVEEPIPGEPDYSWSNDADVIDDFAGSTHDFGTHTPLDINDMPALHIHNSIVRAHRFVLTRSGTGIDTNHVDVLWPDGDNASHVGFLDELYISHRREWEEDTHTHEYGHHFLDEYAVAPASDYCNGFCDTDPDFPVFDCGHCRWCRETDHDAVNEGWPNWLGHFVTNDYPNLYVFSDGSPYEALSSDSDEELRSCTDVDPAVRHDPFLTEGFIGALLHDISDPNVDADGNLFFEEHDNDGDGVIDVDGITDCLDLGAEEIFDVMLNELPTTVTEFLIAFQNRYPDHRSRLWSTAFNVHPDYVGGGIFPPDTQPPGAVQPEDVSSITHPLGVGGPSPCIEVLVEAPLDDVTGACGYSYEWSQIPTGVEPDSDEVGNYVAGSCVTIISHAQSFGDHYVSIRAKDCADHWSNEWDTFGPFTVNECNGNGILDVCEVAPPMYDGVECNASVFGDIGQLSCTPHEDFCRILFGGVCGMGSDCQPNLVPDECDIASGTSEDCNEDGIPDECQDMAHWIAGSGSWHDSSNWEGGGIGGGGGVPVTGQHVCIDVPGDQTVTYVGGDTDLASLACHENLVLDDQDGAPRINLILREASFVRGDLSVGGRDDTQLWNDQTLTVSGLLTVIPGRCWLRGAGDILANGGLNITSRATLFEGKDMYLANNSTSTSTSLIVLNSGCSVHVQAGSTFDYQGDFGPFSGGNGLVVVDGTFARSSGTNDAYVQSPVDNSGLIHNQAAELVLSNGGAHDGDVLSDPGTLLGLGGDHEMETTSSLIADDLELLSGNDSHIRGTVDIAGTLLVNGSGWTFTDEANVASYGQDLFARSGSVHFESPAAPAVDFDDVTVGAGGSFSGIPYFDTGETFVINTLHLVKGNIYGADPITINDSFTWGPGGSFFPGGAVTCNGPVLIQATSSSRTLARIFNNTDYATFLGSIGPSGSGRFNNLATGTVELKGDSTGLTSGQSTNAGLIVKTVGTGRSTLSRMNNSGQIHAQTGEIYFYFSGENNGDILGDPGTLLTFNGTYPMTAGSSLTGDDVKFSGNTFTIDGAVDIAGTLTITGGTCTFTNQAVVTRYGQDVDALTGTFHFESPVPEPTLEFDTVTLGGGSYGAGVYFDTGQAVGINTLSIVNGSVYGSDPITIHDSFTWGGVGSFLYGGKVTCNGASTIQYSSSQRTLYRHFDNAGYATVLGAISVSGYAYTNLPTGTLDLQTDNGRFSLGTTSTLYNNGTLIKSGGTGISPIHVHFRNAGTFEIQSGAVQFTGSYGLTYIQTDGQTVLNGGNLDLVSGAVYDMQGGKLTGAGTVFGDVENTAGSVEPGLPVGRLTVNETYTHATNASMTVTLGGLAPGTLHDQVVVNDTADLQGGELIVETDGVFVPQPGQEFVILTAANGVTGTFGTVPDPEDYTVIYNPNDVTLKVPVPAVPASSIWAQGLLAVLLMLVAGAYLTARKRETSA